MKILMLTKKLPYPVIDGECLVIMNELKALQGEGTSIDVLALNTQKHYSPLSEFPLEVNKLAHFYDVPIDTSIRAWDAMLNLFSSKSYNIQRFWSDAFANKLKQLLNENAYDIIFLQGLYLVQYADIIKANSRAKLVMRSHNVEHEIWQRLAVEEKSFFKKGYLNLLAERMKRYEESNINTCDAMIAITEKDLAKFKQMGLVKPSAAIPGSIELRPASTGEREIRSVFFLGSFDWTPNIQGVYWFIVNVWSGLSQEFPDWQLYIAGRNFKQEMAIGQGEGIHWVGEVKDAVGFMEEKNIMVVPLFSGSGMRIKIIEAMMCGKPIVSTSIGAEGINYTDGENILIADTAESFQKQLIRLMHDNEFAMGMGLNARKNAEASYSMQTVGNRLRKFVFEEKGE